MFSMSQQSNVSDVIGHHLWIMYTLASGLWSINKKLNFVLTCFLVLKNHQQHLTTVKLIVSIKRVVA